MNKLILAAALAGAAITGTAFAAQTTPAAPAPGPGGPGGWHHGHRGDRMMKADTNHDGRISRAEFMASAEQHFARMDANNDGVIDQTERQAMHDRMRARFEKMREMHGGGQWGDHRGPGSGTPPPGGDAPSSDTGQ